MNNVNNCKYHHTINGSNISVTLFNHLTGKESMIVKNANSLTISIKQDYSFFVYYESLSSQNMKLIQVNRDNKLIVSHNNEIIASLNGQMYDEPLLIPLMQESNSSEIQKSDMAQLFDQMGMSDAY